MRVVVTGAAHGIGRESARLMREAGAHVTGLDVDPPEDRLDAFVQVDLADPAAIDAAAAACDGPVDALCNIAGLPPRRGTGATVLAVNFVGMRRFAEAMLPKMAPGGSIVTLASKAGRRWRENLAQVKRFMALPEGADLAAFVAEEGIDPVRAYDLSKEADIVWTIVNAERFAAMDLRANTVSPAAVATRILDDFIAAFGARATAPMARVGREGTPEEVAELVAFLASPRSSWIRGADIAVDGGGGAFALADEIGAA